MSFKKHIKKLTWKAARWIFIGRFRNKSKRVLIHISGSEKDGREFLIEGDNLVLAKALADVIVKHPQFQAVLNIATIYAAYEISDQIKSNKAVKELLSDLGINE